MTIVEMHRNIRIRLNELGAYQYGDLQPEEIDVYLNNTILEFVKKRFNNLGNKYRQGFEQSVKRVTDLNNLVEVVSLNTTFQEQEGDYWIDGILKEDLPSDYMFYISSYVLSKVGDVTDTYPSRTVSNITKSVWSVANYVQHDDIHKLQKDPFNKSYFRAVNMTITDELRYYADDTFTADHISLTYLRKPVTVKNDTENPANNVNCDLSEIVHNEIVELTTSSILADLKGFGPQGQYQNLNDNE